MAAKVTSKTKKDEIWKAYQALSKKYEKVVREKEDLEEQAELFSDLSVSELSEMEETDDTDNINEMNEMDEMDEKNVGIEAGAVPSVANDRTLNGVICDLETIKTRIGTSASFLQQKLTAEAARLHEVHDELDHLRGDLKELHGLDVNESTLNDLVHRYQENSERLEKEYSELQNSSSEKMEIQNEAWRKEKVQHHDRAREQERARKSAEKRSRAEYEYDLEARRRAEADAFEQKNKEQERALDELKATNEMKWSEREKELTRREEEALDLRVRAQGLTTKLEKAVKQARDQAAAATRRQTKDEAALREKEHLGTHKVYEMRIASLEETIGLQSQQLQDLSKQLAQTTKQAQDLAVKALEGASGTSSFDAIKEIALEQAKTSPKSAHR